MKIKKTLILALLAVAGGCWQATKCQIQQNTMEQNNQLPVKSETKEKIPTALTMRYCNKDIPYEREIKNGRYTTFDIDKIHWELILNVVSTAKYDEKQYDEINNPSGYMLKMEEPDYVLTIQYNDNTQEIIQVWRGSSKISMKGWYYIDNKYFYEFHKILENYLRKNK